MSEIRQAVETPPATEDVRLQFWLRDVADALNDPDPGLQTLGIFRRESDPDDPTAGQSVLWVTDGGDVKIKLNVAGTVKTATLVDFSTL